MDEIKNLNLINVLQNPSQHYIGDRLHLISNCGVNADNEEQWIAFENKFSVDNFSGFTGKQLFEIVSVMTVVNMQAGIASSYAENLLILSKERLIQIYFKYFPERKVVYGKETRAIVCYWLHENNYISELELNRLLYYKQAKEYKNKPLDDFNHTLLKEDIAQYV
ncbi:MAG: hypothetical protein ACRCWB_08590 [Enterovibrio sp.]